jgi:serine/threonine protein phosphatase 1
LLPHLLVNKDNSDGRFLVFGDVHGQYSSLMYLLQYLNYQNAEDRLLFVGDLIDRGADSLACLELLPEQGVYACLGNHEQMALDSINDSSGLMHEFWSANGGGWFDALSEQKQRRVETLIKGYMSYTLEFHWRTKRIGLVHADFPEDLNWRELHKPGVEIKKVHLNQMLWSRTRVRGHVKGAVQGIDLVIAGHTMLEQAELSDNMFFLDTGAAAMDRKTELSQPRLSVLVFGKEINLYSIDHIGEVREHSHPINEFWSQ